MNQSEESDGISVISESEAFKAIGSSNDSENEELDKATEAREDGDEYQPITPPTTPMTEVGSIKEQVKELEEDDAERHFKEPASSSTPLFASIAFVFTITVLYLNIRCLKTELQTISTRVHFLEHENQQLRTSLAEIMSKFQAPPDDVVVEAPRFAKEINSAKVPVEKRRPPKTKSVWFGNEIEDKVQILDKKRTALPDYCYFTDENDLFYEYNVVHCEAKRRKLEAKYSKERKRSSSEDFDANPDNAWKVEDKKSYDEYISDTLKSLNDEIQDIKRKRGEPKAKGSSTQTPQEEKTGKLKKIENRRKAKKLQRQKEVNSAEWVEKRTNGREEARKNLENQQQDVNWYLKRKNDREIERVETSAEL